MSQHTEKHWYTRFGIEEPFPWVLFLLAPIWFPRLLWSRRHRIPDNRATLRLWDKDFNLLATWKDGDNLYFTEDGVHGQRRSGLITKIDFTNGPEI